MSNIDWTQIQDAKARAAEADAAAKEAARDEARTYLAGTDWYVTRKLETGEEIPADVAKERMAARALLSE